MVAVTHELNTIGLAGFSSDNLDTCHRLKPPEEGGLLSHQSAVATLSPFRKKKKATISSGLS